MKRVEIAEKNDFVLPQIAKQMDLPATVYYRGKYKTEKEEEEIAFITKDLIGAGETLIQGTSIYKRKTDRRKVNFESLLEATDKYIKKHYKKNHLSTVDMEKARKEIRLGLIKQTIFNKIAFNDNEGNEKWGLVEAEDETLRLAPLFSFNYCFGVEALKSHHRIVNRRKEGVESFISKYAEEPGFLEWIRDKVVPLDINKAIEDMTEETGEILSPNEEEYYKFSFSTTHSKVVDFYNKNFPNGIVSKNKNRVIDSDDERI